MLVSPLGKTYGLVSGGCLEADVVKRARQVYHTGRPQYVVYDSMEEGNVAAELGLGCNGRVGVLIQQLMPTHEALLMKLLDELEAGNNACIAQCFASDDVGDLAHMHLYAPDGTLLFSTDNPPLLEDVFGGDAHKVIIESNRHWSIAGYSPAPCLWVIGGGLDAQPVVSMAALLGWTITVVDHRVGYGRTTDFPAASAFVRAQAAEYCGDFRCDAVIIMSHNIHIDAAWLRALAASGKVFQYIGLLGPASRRSDVLADAGIKPDSAFAVSVHGPMGLDIGGDLPESVALSVISQCHAVLAGKPAYLDKGTVA